MSDVPCGCELEKEAELKARDEAGLMVLKESAAIEQKAWGCPCAGFQPNPSLSEAQIEALYRIQEMTGIDLKDENDEFIFKTCPNYSFNSSTLIGSEIVRAVTARKYRDKGQLQLIEEQPMVNTLVEAMEILDLGFNKAQYKVAQIEKERRKQSDDEFAEHLASLVKSPPLKARISMAYLSDLEDTGDLRQSVKRCREHIETLFRPLEPRKCG